MSSIKDLMVEFLVELLKEERQKRKQIEKELEESNKLMTELIEKVHALKTDITLKKRTRVIANMYRHGRIECDEASGVDEVDTSSIWHVWTRHLWHRWWTTLWKLIGS